MKPVAPVTSVGFTQLCFYRNAQVISLNVSPSLALIPSAADGSNPQWTMQWSQRGSLPAP
jgi:hypothetical protein